MLKTVSLLIGSLDLVDPGLGTLEVHGANVQTSAFIRRLGADPKIGKIEIFLNPAQMAEPAALAKAAQYILPEDRRGRGVLSFYPTHFLPEIWRDGQPRIFFSMDPEWLARDRYLRDSFAAGPTPIFCDTHAFGQHRLWAPLARVAAASPVAYDTLACLSRSTLTAAEKMFRWLLVEKDAPLPLRLDLWPRAVDTQFLTPATEAQRKQARIDLRWPADATIVLYLGRVTPHGKADLLPLARAFAKVARNRPNAVLVIAGRELPPGYAKMVQWTAHALGAEDRVIVAGDVAPENRSIYYAAADIFAFPADSIQDQFATTAIEAMSAGLPVIASEWDGLRDTVVHNETGFLLPTRWMPYNERLSALSPVTPLLTEYLMLGQHVSIRPRDLEDALAKLLDDPGLRLRMGEAGRNRVVDRFSVSKVMDRFHAITDELAAVAVAETPAETAIRRAGAQSLGLPTPYASLFAHYGSAICQNSDIVSLTDLGKAVSKRAGLITFYDETVPLVRQQVVEAILESLKSAGDQGMSLGDLTQSVTAETHVAEDDVRMHLAFMLKQDALDLSSAPTGNHEAQQNARSVKENITE